MNEQNCVDVNKNELVIRKDEMYREEIIFAIVKYYGKIIIEDYDKAYFLLKWWNQDWRGDIA